MGSQERWSFQVPNNISQFVLRQVFIIVVVDLDDWCGSAGGEAFDF
jgi:hypothetical protein